jgi:hypothetical protein
MAGILLIPIALIAVAGGVFVMLLRDEPLSAEEKATTATLEDLERRLDPAVWRQVEAQAWFDNGKTTPDGIRLIRLLSEYFYAEIPFNTVAVLGLYSAGLSEATEQLLLRLKFGAPIRTVARAPWFLDGVDGNEALFIDHIADAGERNWNFDEFLLEVTRAGWFADGIDDKEIAVINAGAALSSANQGRATELIRGLDSDVFIYDKLVLPVSGEKVLIVTAASRELENRLLPALDLVKQWAARVESFAGPYTPQYVVVSVAELSGELCGTGSGQDVDVPGVLTLDLDCVQDRTVVHELAHIFVGTGPTWFTEGVADLVVLHVTGRLGSYQTRPTSGRIDLNFRRGAGGVGSPEYLNQGSLGAKLMVDVYRLLGPQQMSLTLDRMTEVDWPREGRALLDALLASAPDELKPRLHQLIADRFQLP